jgi:hypothetical protein
MREMATLARQVGQARSKPQGGDVDPGWPENRGGVMNRSLLFLRFFRKSTSVLEKMVGAAGLEPATTP